MFMPSKMAACVQRVLPGICKHKLSAFSKNWTFLLENGTNLRSVSNRAIFPSEDLPSDYADAPLYPPCFDTTPKGTQRQRRQTWYDAVLNASTVEEKYLELWPRSDQRYCIHAFHANNTLRHYYTLPMVKFVTRTHFEKGLPPVYQNQDSSTVDAIVEHISPYILDAIKSVFGSYEPYHTNAKIAMQISTLSKENEKARSELMIDHVHRILSLLVGQKFSHVKQSQVDFNARMESFWKAGGFPCSFHMQKYRAKKRLVEGPNDPMHIWCQFFGESYMNVRNEDPLPAFADMDDDVCVATEENRVFNTLPNSYGFGHVFRYPTMVPGFWPGEPCEFGTMSFLTREGVPYYAKKYGVEDVQNALHSYGILNAFGWLVGIAFNKGFTPYQDLTYPITTQTIVTNGQMWSIYNYQLNTVSFSSDFIHQKYRNVCWGTKEMKLFDSVTSEGVVGFNPEVLKCLVQMYLNLPESRVGVSLTPYLRDAEYSDERWAYIAKYYKAYNSNRRYSNRLLPKNYFTLIYKTWFQARFDMLR